MPAQIGSGSLLIGIRPEGVGQTIALERLFAMQQQIRQERQGLGQATKRVRCAVGQDAQMPEEVDL